MNYLNEFDPQAAAWLRELRDAGHIPPCDIDTRSIEDVTPNDLRGYTQCHFFAGIGGWPYAVALAGWPADRPVWTGSCPCQPFSAAGKGAGFDDQRHLWPAWFHLIRQCRPAAVFGEQVASAAVGPWLDLVHADLEGVGYAFGSVAFPAAGVGAPHIRDRTYWVAYAGSEGLQERERLAGVSGRALGAVEGKAAVGRGVRAALGLGDADSIDSRRHGRNGAGAQAPSNRQGAFDGPGGDRIGLAGGDSGLADSDSKARGRAQGGTKAGFGDASAVRRAQEPGRHGGDHPPGPINGHWRAADWLGCRDGKWRPVEPGTFPLAHGLPARVGRLRGYGNAIVPQAAAEFIRAAEEGRLMEVA